MRTILMTLLLAVGGGCVPQPVIPGPHREPIKAVVVRGVERVDVKIAPWGYAGWVVDIVNRRDDQVRVVWDESSFIDARGFSYGRLIRGKTRVLDLARTQPTTPVAPGARAMEYAVSEELAQWTPAVQYVDDDETAVDPGRDVCAEMRKECTLGAEACAKQHQRCKLQGRSAAQQDAAEGRRIGGIAAPPVRAGVGRLTIVFDGARGRELWECAVSMDGSALPVIKPVETKPEETK